MIEIKDIHGRVLYTATTASDIHAALIEAVSNHVDLQHANLQGAHLQLADLQRAHLQLADLQGAHLQRADLQHANLQGADLQGADLRLAHLQRADLRGAHLQLADLQGADLQRADLQRADLQGADLRGAHLQLADLQLADLQGADLRGAHLQLADLRGAHFQRAYGVSPERVTPLLLLLDQPGRIIAYKLVTANGQSPIHTSRLTYTIGETLTIKNANTDTNNQCGAGINLATLDWCLQEWRPGYRILRCSFRAKDIAVIPTATDGKFRVHRCKVESEVDVQAIHAKEA